MTVQNRMLINLRLCIITLLIFSAFSSIAKTLPIGLTLNISGPNAYDGLEFKSGIDAFIYAENKRNRFGDHQLKLYTIDDANQKSRALDNAIRLIAAKNILVMLSNHSSHIVSELTQIASDTKTLLLTTNHHQQPLNIRQHRYLGFLSPPFSQILANVKEVLANSNTVYIASNDHFNYQAIAQAVTQITNTSPVPFQRFSVTKVEQDTSCSVIIDDSAYVAKQITEAHIKAKSNCTIVVMPNVDKHLLTDLLPSHCLTPKCLFLDVLPLNNDRLPLVSQFKADFNQFSSQSRFSQQAFKGYILAKLAAEAIYKSLNNLQNNPALKVINLPLKADDKPLDSPSGSNYVANKKTVVNAFSYLKNYDIGLEQPIKLVKERVLINKITVSSSKVYQVRQYSKSNRED